MNPMVTMIIPVYNAQDSIRCCIESVLNQGYMDFELLLIAPPVHGLFESVRQ